MDWVVESGQPIPSDDGSGVVPDAGGGDRHEHAESIGGHEVGVVQACP